jgi:hypothetical protein
MTNDSPLFSYEDDPARPPRRPASAAARPIPPCRAASRGRGRAPTCHPRAAPAVATTHPAVPGCRWAGSRPPQIPSLRAAGELTSVAPAVAHMPKLQGARTVSMTRGEEVQGRVDSQLQETCSRETAAGTTRARPRGNHSQEGVSGCRRALRRLWPPHRQSRYILFHAQEGSRVFFLMPHSKNRVGLAGTEGV